jgi:CheY-like chemotaxis protein
VGPGEAPAGKGRPTPHALRIMVVDDNKSTPRDAGDAAGSAGHTVFVEFDAGAALNRARARIRPTVFLLDIGLPEMDGYELARRLRSPRPRARC